LRKFGQMEIIKVKVKANAKKDEILEKEKGFIRIAIKAKPIQGKANQHLIKFLEKQLNCKVEIIRGLSSSTKLIKII